MSNKSAGTAFEKIFAKLLSERGFWAHRLQDNQNGQPFDIIASKNSNTYVFDCKDCTGRYFNFNRIEENQKSAMDLWQECGNNQGMFAVRYPDDHIYIFPYDDLMAYKRDGMASISLKEAPSYGYDLDEFMEGFMHESNDKQ